MSIVAEVECWRVPDGGVISAAVEAAPLGAFGPTGAEGVVVATFCKDAVLH